MIKMYKIKNLFVITKNLIFYKKIRPTRYLLDTTKKFIYVTNPKVANTSIKHSICNANNLKSKNSNIKITFKLDKDEEEYFKFTFVRNPFERLVSCYKNKIKNGGDGYYKYYLFGYINNISFEDFINRFSKIPKFITDWHFTPQFDIIYGYKNIEYDFIGRIENIDKDFKKIQEKFDLDPISHLNKSYKKDWREYYTEETAKTVYDIYKKDFDTWYPDKYYELINYLSQKTNLNL